MVGNAFKSKRGTQSAAARLCLRVCRQEPTELSLRVWARGSRDAEEVSRGSSGGARNRPKIPVPDRKWAAATNREIPAGFGAGASVRRRARERPQPPDLCSRPQPPYTGLRIAYTPPARPRAHTRFPTPTTRKTSTTGQSWLQKGDDDSVGTRRRRHELAHHDGVRVLG